MARGSMRQATLADLDLLVHHRRHMWEEISDLAAEELDAQDVVYRRWARTRLTSGRLIGFIVETPRGEGAASGCLWLSPSQPRPRWKGLTVPYLMSMYTEPAHRGKGYATWIVRESIRWSRRRGFNVVTLHASDAGRSIYEKEGFAPTREMRLRLDAPRRTDRSEKGRRSSR